MSSNSGSPVQQQSISRYFNAGAPKRPSSPNAIDLTLEDSETERPVKRPKTSVSKSKASLSTDIIRSKPATSLKTSSSTTSSSAKTQPVAQRGKKKKKEAQPFPMDLGKSAGPSSVNKKSSRSTSAGTPVPKPAEVENDSDGSSPEEGVKALRAKFGSRFGDGGTKSSKRAEKAIEEVGPSGETWTPLEKQVLQLKKEFPGVVLLIHEGYKYRFFGDDAKIAAKELGMVCYQKRNFLNASIPVDRKNIHLKKLLSQGYKVGIVGQLETAALKRAGDNRGGLFKRGLEALYTAATYVDDLDSADDVANYATGSAPALMCLIEEDSALKGSQGVSLGMLSVTPSTGDVVYDAFDDGVMRSELETRLSHIRPCELLLSTSKMSQETESLIKHIRDRGENAAGGRVREERFKGSPMDYSTAFEAVSSFYKAKESDISGPSSGSSEETRMGKLVAAAVDLPQIVIVALAHVIQYLKQFELADVLAQTKFFMPFGNRHGMLLNANTIDNLEIFQNQTDFKEYGSLWWTLDRTKTKFGKRMLKHWVARPLTDKRLLQERIDAVEELNEDGIATLTKLKMMMKGLPDLAKGLSRIQYGTCTASELASVLSALQRISTTFPTFTVPQDVGFKSTMLNELVFPLPQLRTPVQEIISEIDLNKARLNELSGLWRDEDKYEAVGNANYNIMFLESDLQDHLKEVRKTLHRPSLQYKTIAGEEFLIEVPNEDSASVPASWTRVSKTKKDTRYHSPFIQDKLREREEYKETLVAEAKSAFRAFLRDISNKHYGLFRDVVQKLATVDCLLSLAHVALQSSYTKPVLGDDVIDIVGGRHPMIEAIRSDPYIPNSIKIGDGSPRSKIVTGPNMGGKSSCVRMIALICIMAQIGSYVPAESARLGILDSVLTRMGASDDIARGKSTFMVEISETADILRLATSNSLVVLDELGRGTATFDGMAIASAVLQHLVQSINCKALFITHYSSVAEDMAKIFRRQIENVHMNFVEEEKLNGTREIHFLYTLTSGIASGSFGIECARLAGLPEKVLEAATVRAQTMQGLVRRRTVINKSRRLLSLSQGIMESRITSNMEATRIVAALHDLRQALLSV